MVRAKGSEKRVVIYQDKSGILFIQPSTKIANRKYKVNQDFVEYADINKDSNEELGKKLKDALEKCN